MGYNSKTWYNRIRHRTDISGYLTHLTKGNENQSAIDILIKILKERKIKGSSNSAYIVGGHRAVSFQDIPLYSVCQNVLHEMRNQDDLGGKVRYEPVGLSFGKLYVYKRGGRPVIYEKLKTAKKFINKEEWWRIVSLDLSNDNQIIDWTHEREWRVKENFIFNLSEAYVIFAYHSHYKKFIESAGENNVKNIGGIVVLDPILT